MADYDTSNILARLLEYGPSAEKQNPLVGDGPSTADVLARMSPRNRLVGAFSEKPMPDLAEMLRQRQGGMLTKDQIEAGYAEPHRDILSGILPRVQDVAGRGLTAIPDSAALAANFLPGIKGALPRIEKPIRAYHGSPHDFDKFDLSKIGTGEGAQAYGHGLYFAEHEPVARAYRDQNATKGVDWERIKSYDPELPLSDEHAAGVYRQLHHPSGTPAEAAQHMQWAHADLRQTPVDRLANVIQRAQDEGRGRMYEVALHASPEQFLDWDKPLSGQPEAVRMALRDRADALQADPSSGPRRGGKHVAQHYMETDKPAAETYFSMGDSMGGRDKLSAALNEAGIPGIKYLDQGSRGMRVGPSSPANDIARQWLESVGGDQKQAMAALEGHLRESGQAIEGNGVMAALRDMRPPTSNYVVWSPEIIEILRKYGLAGATPTAGASLASILSQPSPTSQQQ